MNIDVYNTHIELYPYEYGDYPSIESKFTAIEKVSGKEFPCGYIIESGKMFLARGMSISFLEDVTGCKANYVTEDDPRDYMKYRGDITIPPRNDIQQQAIDYLIQDEAQLGFDGKTGFGKTYCVSNAITQLHEKTIIITPVHTIQIQWYAGFRETFKYKEDRIMVIRGNKMMEAILNDEIEEADIYLVSHSTLHNFIMTHNGFMLHEFFKKIRVGIKVFDETHAFFENTLLVDFFTNTHRTWYLSATFGRSDPSERECFLRAFSSVKRFGYKESKLIMPNHVIYHSRFIRSNITQKQRAALLSYPGFTSAKYGKYAFFTDKNETCYKEILGILNMCKNLPGKTLIFVPIIEAVNLLGEKLKKDIKDKTVGVYHSKISMDEKMESEKKDIIISTIKSCGTGKDIKGLQVVICAEPIASKIVTEQTIGRLRPLPYPDECHYFDIVDLDIPPCFWWYRARSYKVKEIVKVMI